MAAKKKSKAYKRAMRTLASVSQTAKDLGVTKPKMRGKISMGKKKKK